MDLSVLVNWMSSFVVVGFSGEFCPFYSILHRKFCEQTVLNLKDAESRLNLYCSHKTDIRSEKKVSPSTDCSLYNLLIPR